MKIHDWMIAGGLLLIGSFTALADDRVVDQSKPAPADGTVTIENFAGSVKVIAWDKGVVQVKGELDDVAERLDFEQRGNFTRIKVVYPRSSRNVHGSDLEIFLPRKSKTEIDSVSADIDIAGMTGNLRANTVSGEIVAASQSQEVVLESISGEIIVKESGKDARISAQTVSGDIEMRAVNGQLELGSISGSIMIDRGEYTRVEANNTSGDIEVKFTGGFAEGSVYRFETISGSIDLEFDELPDAEFDIATFSGSIRNDFGPEATRTSRFGPGRELKFREGEGNGDFRISTLSGSIRLQSR